MKTPENNFLKKIGKSIKNGALGLGVLGVGAYVASQENPSTLQEGAISTLAVDSIYKNFDTETAQELTRLEGDYVQLVHNKDSDLDSAELKQRFRSLVAKYGEGLRIVHSGKERDVRDKVSNTVFTRVLRQPEERAHYMAGTTYYENNPGNYETFENTEEKIDSLLVSSPNFDAFIAEFSHHINHDTKIGRMIEYGQDYIESGFNQEGMYQEVGSVEFQAHKITEWAVKHYLINGPGEFPGISFESLKNNLQGTYEALLKYENFSKETIWNIYYEYFFSMSGNEESLAEYQESFLGRVAVADALIKEVSVDRAVKERILNNPQLMMYALQQKYDQEKMKEYVQALVVLSDVGKGLSENRFDILKKLSRLEVIYKNPAYLEKLPCFINEGESKEKFLNNLSIQQGREYVKNIIPVYQEMIRVAEKKQETGELTGTDCGDLYSEFESTEQYVLLKILEKTKTQQDGMIWQTLRDYKKYPHVLYYSQPGRSKREAAAFLKEISPDFYRRAHAEALLEK